MVNLIFYPIGNADCCYVALPNGRVLIFDYAHCVAGEDEEDCRIDLKAAIEGSLKQAKRTDVDVLCLSHADDDHLRGAPELFWLEHAEVYQGEGRVKIGELWVPAGLLLETCLTDDARIMRAEARHRLREGKGIKVFSSPKLLDSWFGDEGIDPKSREHLLVDAGTLAPGFTIAADDVEFFVHSPFAHRDDDTLQPRNEGSIYLQGTFEVGGVKTRVMLGADTHSNVLQEMIEISQFHGNEERLEWDVYKLSHHCSYTALNMDDKGKTKTQPSAEIDAFFKNGHPGGIIVSPSKPIPTEDTTQPPHFQTAAYYKEVAEHIGGQFIVTMEHPTKKEPKPLEITIGKFGATVQKAVVTAAAAVTSSFSPRMG